MERAGGGAERDESNPEDPFRDMGPPQVHGVCALRELTVFRSCRHACAASTGRVASRWSIIVKLN